MTVELIKIKVYSPCTTTTSSFLFDDSSILMLININLGDDRCENKPNQINAKFRPQETDLLPGSPRSDAVSIMHDYFT